MWPCSPICVFSMFFFFEDIHCNCFAIKTEENLCYSTFLSWFYSVEKHRATVAPPACNRGATGSYRDITVNNLGTMQHRGIQAWNVAPPCCTVSAPWWTGNQPASCFLEDRGYTGKVRTQFIFYEMCPGTSRYTGCHAPGCTVATPAQWELMFLYNF